MQVKGSYSSSTPLIDKSLNSRSVNEPLTTQYQQSAFGTTEATSRSLGDIVVSLRSDLAIELPKHPGFAKQDQDIPPAANLSQQNRSDQAGSDRNLVDSTATVQRLNGLNSAREARAAQAAVSQPSATDRKPDSNSERQVIDEVA